MSAKRLRSVILADDDRILHEGVSLLLEQHGYQVVASASNYEELKQYLRDKPSDFIISDCSMPGDGPGNFLEYAKRFYPQRKLIYLTGVQSGSLFQYLLDNGVDGLVSKRDSIHCLVSAIEEIDRKGVFLSDTVKAYLNNSLNKLTPKEMQVLELIIQGRSNPNIAKSLTISPSTVGRHRENLMRKLDAHSVVDLLKFAQQQGFFSY